MLASYSPVTETLLAPLREIQFFLVDDKKVLNTKDLEWLKQNLPANKGGEHRREGKHCTGHPAFQKEGGTCEECKNNYQLP